MLTFLEFYSTLLHFVLYKLYNEAGLVYPPTIEKSIGLSGYVLEDKNAPLKRRKKKMTKKVKTCQLRKFQKPLRPIKKVM